MTPTDQEILTAGSSHSPATYANTTAGAQTGTAARETSPAGREMNPADHEIRMAGREGIPTGGDTGRAAHPETGQVMHKTRTFALPARLEVHTLRVP